MVKQALGEVFGFPVDNLSMEAGHYRQNKLCPFNNKVPSCTKDEAIDPSGVCSIMYDDDPVITCPVRFRQDWRIAADAADFFFPQDTAWTSLIEVGLTDGEGMAAGSIDVVLVSYDDHGNLLDFGALDVQAVYVSGDARHPFGRTMRGHGDETAMSWPVLHQQSRLDDLSSSWERLAPQLLQKGSILKAWGKKQAVAVQRSFYRTLPSLPQVTPDQADLVWLIYDLDYDAERHTYTLVLKERAYSLFEPALDRISKPSVGSVDSFLDQLQSLLDANDGDVEFDLDWAERLH